MDFLANIDASTLVWLVSGCCLLCGGGVVLIFASQMLGSVLGLVSGIFGTVMGVVAGGPVAWCGCAVLVFGLCTVTTLGIYMVNLTASCATNPVNFCRFLGY